MSEVQFTNLLGVAVVACLAPLALGFVPRVRVPAIVVEIALGVLIGPVLGWAHVDTPVSILALIGLSFLLFLAGLEVDVQRFRGRTVGLTVGGFVISLLLGIVLGVLLSAGGLVKSPLFIAIVLVSTSLGVVVPVLKDSGNITSCAGELVIAASSFAEFGAIVLLSLFFSGKGSTGAPGRLALLVVFGLAVLLVALAAAGVERFRRLSRVLLRLQDTTAQIRVRGAFALLVGFVALAQAEGLETILGAFAAGAMLSVVDRDQTMTHPEFRVKLEGAGFGVFVPVFFVASGMRLDVNALFASTSAVARIALFLIALLIVRGLPALLYSRVIGRRRSIAAGLLQATSLTFIVAATQIGVQLGVVTDTSAAALVAAGLVSVIVFPLLGLSLLDGSGGSGVALVAPTPSGAVSSVTYRRAVGRPRA